MATTQPALPLGKKDIKSATSGHIAKFENMLAKYYGSQAQALVEELNTRLYGVTEKPRNNPLQSEVENKTEGLFNQTNLKQIPSSAYKVIAQLNIIEESIKSKKITTNSDIGKSQTLAELKEVKQALVKIYGVDKKIISNSEITEFKRMSEKSGLMDLALVMDKFKDANNKYIRTGNTHAKWATPKDALGNKLEGDEKKQYQAENPEPPRKYTEAKNVISALEKAEEALKSFRPEHKLPLGKDYILKKIQNFKVGLSNEIVRDIRRELKSTGPLNELNEHLEQFTQNKSKFDKLFIGKAKSLFPEAIKEAEASNPALVEHLQKALAGIEPSKSLNR